MFFMLHTLALQSVTRLDTFLYISPSQSRDGSQSLRNGAVCLVCTLMYLIDSFVALTEASYE